MVVEQQQYQHGEVAGGEGQQVVAGFVETCLQVGFEGNDTGHGGDDGVRPRGDILLSRANIFNQTGG